MPSKTVLVKHSTILAVYLLVVWGFYRFLFQLPEQVEELFIKPVVWIVPVLILINKEHSGLSSLRSFFTWIYFQKHFSRNLLFLGIGSDFCD